MPDQKTTDKAYQEKQLDVLEDLLLDESLEGTDAPCTDDMRAEAEDVRRLLHRSLKKAEQSRLTDARKRYEERRARGGGRATSRIPTSPIERRARLSQLIAAHPQLTYANRDFCDDTDADIESALRQLEQLGLLEDGTTDK